MWKEFRLLSACPPPGPLRHLHALSFSVSLSHTSTIPTPPPRTSPNTTTHTHAPNMSSGLAAVQALFPAQPCSSTLCVSCLSEQASLDQEET